MTLYQSSILGGPEQVDKEFDQQITAIVRHTVSLQTEMIKRDDGILNVIFQFQGSLFRPDFIGIKIGRFVRKENRLEVKVAVSPDVICSDDFALRYASLLKKAITEAKKVFDKKGIPFSLEDHLALVDKSLEGLMETHKDD
jgi:hypothetical protein